VNSNYNNFQSWFVLPLKKLFSEKDSGFIILMVIFPILERYLRQKIRLPTDQALNPEFYKELVKLFPILQDDQVARQFWQIYRNGILHEVTLSQMDRKKTPMPIGWISPKYQAAVAIESDESLWINPIVFAQRIIQIIETDFSTFEGPNSLTSQLPVVVDLINTQKSGNGSSPYLGTRGGP
jgi:hypothetical protein